MTTRRRSTSAVILGIMAVMLAPVHAAAYDVGAARPDASAARFMLPDLEMDAAMDPFGDNLMPRRAMEHPREWYEGALWGLAGVGCAMFCSFAAGVGFAVGGFAYAMLTLETGRTEDIYLPS